LFQQGSQNVPVIVTNKHVVTGANDGHFKLTMQKDDGSPDLQNFIDVTVPNFPTKWIPHPDPAVDHAMCQPSSGINGTRQETIFYLA
jgi:hypothetical protein